MRPTILGAALMGAAICSSAMQAQSLAEVARREAERRAKADKQRVDVRSYADADLAGAPQVATSPATPTSTAPPTATPREADTLLADRAGRARQEAFWRSRVTDARSRLAQAERSCSTDPLVLGGG